MNFRDRRVGSLVAALVMTVAGFSALNASQAVGAKKRCFGKKIDRVIGPGERHMVNASDRTFWLKPGVKFAVPRSARVCANAGRQLVIGGRGRVRVWTGAGSDVVRLDDRSHRNQVFGGGGNDRLFGAKGNDRLVGGAGNDLILGAGGNDRIADDGGKRNKLLGEEGSDRIESLGTSVSELHGGGGSDFLYSNGGVRPDGAIERLFGEKGNDRLMADQPHNQGPAYLDGGEGDDWMYGTPVDDIAVFNSGIKKVHMGGGDDLMVSSGRGKTTVAGGSGTDTISYEALVPATDPFRLVDGIRVRLVAGISEGFSTYSLSGIENVIGSAFRDEISGVPGQDNEIRGSLGNDILFGDDSYNKFEEPFTPIDPDGDPNDSDVADGGLGGAICVGFRVTERCGNDSPPNPEVTDTVVSIEEGGFLTILGSNQDDNLSVRYEDDSGAYEVTTDAGTNTVLGGLCHWSAPAPSVPIICPADINRLTGMMVFGGIGDDHINLDRSIPSELTTTLNGGPGSNHIRGGPSKDFISSDIDEPRLDEGSGGGSAGSILRGGGNLDVIYANDAVDINGGSGPDAFRVLDPCLGATLAGGDDPDSVVFAGAPQGVKANLAEGYAQWNDATCQAPTSIARDIEKLEGSGSDDWLILGKRLPEQQGKSTLLGREGINILDAKNGDRNTITTGPEEHENTVKADPSDKIIWGWGLAAF